MFQIQVKSLPVLTHKDVDTDCCVQGLPGSTILRLQEESLPQMESTEAAFWSMISTRA